MPKSRRNTLHRHVALVVAGKFLLLALLWWVCVRDYRSDPGSAEVRAALLPESTPVVETRKEPQP